MFKFVLLNGARLELKNRLNYTPLALATKLARKEVNFIFIKIDHFFLLIKKLDIYIYNG